MNDKWVKRDSTWTFTRRFDREKFPHCVAITFDIQEMSARSFSGTFSLTGATIGYVVSPTLEEAQADLAKMAAAFVGEIASFVHASKETPDDRRGAHSWGSRLRRCRVCGVYGDQASARCITHEAVHEFVDVDADGKQLSLAALRALPPRIPRGEP